MYKDLCENCYKIEELCEGRNICVKCNWENNPHHFYKLGVDDDTDK